MRKVPACRGIMPFGASTEGISARAPASAMSLGSVVAEGNVPPCGISPAFAVAVDIGAEMFGCGLETNDDPNTPMAMPATAAPTVHGIDRNVSGLARFFDAAISSFQSSPL